MTRYLPSASPNENRKHQPDAGQPRGAFVVIGRNFCKQAHVPDIMGERFACQVVENLSAVISAIRRLTHARNDGLVVNSRDSATKKP
jgi:hypothetical protein